MNTTFIWVSALIIMNSVWAGSYTVMKLATGSLSPLVIVFWRMLIAALMLMLWCFVRRYSWRIKTHDLGRMFFVGTLSAISHLLVVTGINYSQAGEASLLYVIEPVWGIILATLFLKERFSKLMGLSVILVFIGAAIISLNSNSSHHISGMMAAVGNIIIAVGLICEGSFSIAIKPVINKYPVEVTLTIILFSSALVLFLPTIFVAPRVVPISQGEWIQILYLAFFCSVIGYLGWLTIMKHVPINVMNFSIFLQPIMGPFIAWLFIGEKITSAMLVAAIFLIMGLFIAITSHIKGSRIENFAESPLLADVV